LRSDDVDVVEFLARPLILLSRYLGDDEGMWSEDFRTVVIDRLDLMVRFDPTSIVARDQSYFSTTRACLVSHDSQSTIDARTTPPR